MPATTDDLLTCREVCDMLKVHRATVYSLMKTDGLPAPIKLGPKRSRWRRGEILEYLQSRRRSKGIAEPFFPKAKPA